MIEYINTPINANIIKDEKWSLVKRYSKGKWLYIDSYAVSTLGRMYSFKNNVLMSINCKTSKYQYFSMIIDGKLLTTTLHRVVASTFLENTKEGLVIHHKDGNKMNNTADNLEWVSQRYNIIQKEKAISISQGCHIDNVASCYLSDRIKNLYLLLTYELGIENEESSASIVIVSNSKEMRYRLN